METAQKIQICQVVAQAILADGKITDTEQQFLDTLMDKYELTSDQRKTVVARNLNDDPAAMVASITDFITKNELIVELVMAVAADNELSKTEQQLLEKVADAIGVDRADMEMLVKNALM